MFHQRITTLTAVFLTLMGVSACGPKAALVQGRIAEARTAIEQAREAGADEHAESLMLYAEDLLDQAESATARGDTQQGLLSADLAIEKANAARDKAVEETAPPAAGEAVEQ